MHNLDLESLDPANLSTDEDDSLEFKSSRTPTEELKRKLSRAVSAFANSGGGAFFYGIDDDGHADGGVEPKVGKEDLKNWLDKAVNSVNPTPAYAIKLFGQWDGKGTLDVGKVIAAVSIYSSEIGPHQASDHVYYIRAGAHTNPAPHYLVEALWARRYTQKPVLSHSIRLKPQSSSHIIQLGVVVATASAALEVEFSITPAKGVVADYEKYFPIRIPIVDMNNPFYIDIGFPHNAMEDLADTDVNILYKDSRGNSYTYKNKHPLNNSVSPFIRGQTSSQKIVKSLDNINSQLKAINAKIKTPEEK